MSETAGNAAGAAVKDIFDLAEHATQAAANAAGNVVGAAGDTASAVVDLGEGIGKLSVSEASDLVSKVLGRLRSVAGA